MALPASLPPWLQTVNTGMFGRGAQLGEEMRANRAAEQFKQQELMRQRQQDAIAQKQHEEEKQRQAQRDAISDQQWKAEFGLRQQQEKARIDATAKKFAALQQYQAAMRAAGDDPKKQAAALAQFGPAMGMNPGAMLSAQERTRSADVDRRNRAAVALHNAQMRNAEQRRKDALKETPQQREKREERELQIKDLQKEIQQFQKDNALGLAPGNSPEHEKGRKGLQNELNEMKGRLNDLYAPPNNQENQGGNVLPTGGAGTGNAGGNAPTLSWNPKTGWSDQQSAAALATPAPRPAPTPPPWAGLTGAPAAVPRGVLTPNLSNFQAAPKTPPMAPPPAPAQTQPPAPTDALRAALLRKALLDQLGTAQVPEGLTNQPPVATP